MALIGSPPLSAKPLYFPQLQHLISTTISATDSYFDGYLLPVMGGPAGLIWQQQFSAQVAFTAVNGHLARPWVAILDHQYQLHYLAPSTGQIAYSWQLTPFSLAEPAPRVLSMASLAQSGQTLALLSGIMANPKEAELFAVALPTSDFFSSIPYLWRRQLPKYTQQHSLQWMKLATGQMALCLTAVQYHPLSQRYQGILQWWSVQGEKIQQLTLPITTELLQLTELSALDTQGLGYVDYLYIGDSLGQLWQIDISAAKPQQWQRSAQPKFINQYQGQTGALRTKPVVSRHHSGEGFMVYLVAQHPLLTGIQILYGVWDDEPSSVPNNGGMPSKSWLSGVNWARQWPAELMQPVLRGKVLVMTGNFHSGTQVWTIDAISGQDQAEGVVLKVNPTLLNRPYIPDSLTPVLPLTMPCDRKNQIYLPTPQGLGWAELAVDAQDLGRHSWQVAP